MDNVKINYGTRYSEFRVLGPGTVYIFDSNGDAADSTSYSNKKLIKYCGGLEPRLGINFYWMT
ncbi:MAG: hypothetical protein J7K40_05965 [candidate division Zixibacteria bacterium]|nr:hypothetical protein [candidate division Zixibacteria bacterium]